MMMSVALSDVTCLHLANVPVPERISAPALSRNSFLRKLSIGYGQGHPHGFTPGWANIFGENSAQSVEK